ncbi:MAG: hypothetical protein ACK55I_22420, partial [bacterium]
MENGDRRSEWRSIEGEFPIAYRLIIRHSQIHHERELRHAHSIFSCYQGQIKVEAFIWCQANLGDD